PSIDDSQNDCIRMDPQTHGRGRFPVVDRFSQRIIDGKRCVCGKRFVLERLFLCLIDITECMLMKNLFPVKHFLLLIYNGYVRVGFEKRSMALTESTCFCKG